MNLDYWSSLGYYDRIATFAQSLHHDKNRGKTMVGRAQLSQGQQGLPSLPIGEASFANLRSDKRLYVDKTGLLEQLLADGRYFFLARPRRFGKSLTISTLRSMFKGEYQLFCGLRAEAWVCQRSNEQIPPILSLDFSKFDSTSSAEALNHWLNRKLVTFADAYHITLTPEASSAETFDTLLERLSTHIAPVVILIDEYDAPILDNLNDFAKIEQFRKILRQFYQVIKGSQDCIRFLFICGISKFTKTGIFSAVNNLIDISMHKKYSSLCGYTQEELETYFTLFIDDALKQKIAGSRQDLLDTIRNYYDGFSFDGETKVYNPFSLLNFFYEYKFLNFWYESGSVSFIENYFKDHHVESPEKYHRIKVKPSMLAPREIENANPESFLYQAGYLTIVERTDNYVILDYPNQEVLGAISEMYLTSIYQIENFVDRGKSLWQALRQCDWETVLRIYNAAIASLPYHDFFEDHQRSLRGESFYRSLFLMLLRACGIQAHGEMPTCRGRSDVVIENAKYIIVIEFKLAHRARDIPQKRREGEQQIQSSGYLEAYAHVSIPVHSAVFIIDEEKRQIVTT
ncbi:MAG: AAA family ATPase [Desulfovibrio sp.]|nr:AAA family ATPase [Desulfovibrio sp.]